MREKKYDSNNSGFNGVTKCFDIQTIKNMCDAFRINTKKMKEMCRLIWVLFIMRPGIFQRPSAVRRT